MPTDGHCQKKSMAERGSGSRSFMAKSALQAERVPELGPPHQRGHQAASPMEP